MGPQSGLYRLSHLGLSPLNLATQLPNLAQSNHDRRSDPTDNYNCIAHAYGIDNRRMWPNQAPRYWWPPSIRNDGSIEAFIDLFLDIGYELCDSADPEEGFEKVALYATAQGPTHAARQLASGRWTSKLGNAADIDHDLAENVEGPGYGQAVRFLKRPLPQAH